MPLTNDQAVIQVQERLKNLQSLLHDIDSERKKGETTITNINRTAKSTTNMQNKLKALYKTGLLEASKEEALLRQALKKITEIREIRNERRIQARNAGNKVTIRQGELMKMVHSLARTLPLFISKLGEKAPPLCGSIPADPDTVSKAGDMVAALVKLGSEKGVDSDWILAEVVQYIHNSGKYEVVDVDAELKTKTKYRHVLSKRNIIPLPLWRANPATDGHALYQNGQVVMALYPQTTTFYKGVISKIPETPNDDYQILFDDNSYKSGFSPPYRVAQRYVFSLKQSKKSTTS
jgi:SAGA-associated factor 29